MAPEQLGKCAWPTHLAAWQPVRKFDGILVVSGLRKKRGSALFLGALLGSQRHVTFTNLHLLIIMLVVLSSLVMFTDCIRPNDCRHRIYCYLFLCASRSRRSDPADRSRINCPSCATSAVGIRYPHEASS